MADVALTGQPVLLNVEVIKNDTGAPFAYTVRCHWRAYVGSTPIEAETNTGLASEDMPDDFFQSDVVADVGIVYDVAGYTVDPAWTLPPVATTTEVWNPATNAPYP